MGVLVGIVIAAPTLARDIPPEVVRNAGAIQGDQQTAIQAHVTQNVPDLRDPQTQKRKEARQKLLEPLADAEVSVSFRQAYTNVLVPELAPLVKDPSDVVAISGLIIAGKLATERAAGLVVPELQAKAASVRYVAVSAIGDTLNATGNSAAAIRADTGVDLVRALEKQLVEETDPFIVHRLVLSLREGMSGPKQLDQVRGESLRALSAALDARLKKLAAKKADPDLFETYILAGSVIRDGLVGGNPPPKDAVVAAGKAGGQMIAYVGRLVSAGAYPGKAPRDLPVKLVAAGEAVVHFAQVAVQQQPVKLELATDTRGVSAATNAGDAKFLSDAAGLIGPSGLLTKEPFNIPPAEFPTR